MFKDESFVLQQEYEQIQDNLCQILSLCIFGYVQNLNLHCSGLVL